LSRKWRGGFQTQIDELKGTNRDTAPSREKILERIEYALKMADQYLQDLQDGFRMGPGEWVGEYIAKAEALIELLEIHDCGSVGASTLTRAAIPCTGCFTLNNALKPQAQVRSEEKEKPRCVNTPAGLSYLYSEKC
jgi:hypothetical protein